MIATGAPLVAVLDAMCRVIDQRSGLMSAVFRGGGDGRLLTQVAGPHFPDECHQATSSVPLTPRPTSCGAAMRPREQVFLPHAVFEPLFQTFRELLRANAMGAWSTPFYARDRREERLRRSERQFPEDGS